MTPDQIRRRVESVRRLAGDDEAAHSMEDGLHQEVLAAIATGAIAPGDAAACAQEALATRLLQFERWCA